MKTSKPFSTISYNTADFLSVKLNDLVNRRKIAFWAYVEHLPEEDMVIYVIDTGTSMRIFVHTYSITCSERISKKLRCFLSIQIVFILRAFISGTSSREFPPDYLKEKQESDYISKSADIIPFAAHKSPL